MQLVKSVKRHIFSGPMSDELSGCNCTGNVLKIILFLYKLYRRFNLNTVIEVGIPNAVLLGTSKVIEHSMKPRFGLRRVKFCIFLMSSFAYAQYVSLATSLSLVCVLFIKLQQHDGAPSKILKRILTGFVVWCGSLPNFLPLFSS